MYIWKKERVLDVNSMLEYCNEVIGKKNELMRDALRLGFVDVSKLYAWIRCKEVFGKEKIVKVKQELVRTQNGTQEMKITPIRRYSNSDKSVMLKELEKEVGLTRNSLYNYARIKRATELLTKENLFYLYCAKHLFFEDFFDILFQTRKYKVNRSKKLIEYIINHPDISEIKDKNLIYKEDTVEKYLRQLRVVVVNNNGELDTKIKKAIKNKSGIDYDEQEIIYIEIKRYNQQEKKFIIAKYGEKYGDEYEIIKASEIGYDVCKKIRNISKKNKGKIVLIKPINKKMFTTSKEYCDLQRTLTYLSAFKPEIFIMQESKQM